MYKQKKRQSIEASHTNQPIGSNEIESNQKNNQSEIYLNEPLSSQKMFDHKFVDYMLSLDDVHEAELSQFMEKQVAEYDSYIFCDPDEEVVYKHQVDWNCQLDFLLRNIS